VAPIRRQHSRVARFLRREPSPSGLDLAVYATKQKRLFFLRSTLI